MKKIAVIAVSLLVVVLAVVVAWKASRPALQKITVVCETWSPYEIIGSGTTNGIHVEMLQAVAGKIGVELQFRQDAWTNCLTMVREGKADAIMSLSETPEREKFLVYPDEGFNVEETVLIVRKGSPFKWSGKLDDLKKVRLGIQKDYWYGKEFEDAGLLSNDVSGTTEEMIGKVLSGKVDAGIATRIVTIDTLRKMGKSEQVVFLDPPLQADTLYIAFSKTASQGKAAKMAPIFSKALADYKMNPAYFSMLKRYGLSRDSKAR